MDILSDIINNYDEQETRRIMESMTIEIIDEAYSVKNNNISAKIFVKGQEGEIPHFHLVLSGGKESCICIFEAMYFNHNKKYITLDDDKLFGLNVFLMSPTGQTIQDKKLNYWDQIVIEWRNKNMDHSWEHDNDWSQVLKPDYRVMKGDRYIR